MKTARFTIYYLMISAIFLSRLIEKDANSMCLRSKNVSGGEDHTMVLTENGLIFTCGLDSVYGFYSGALGIGTFSGSYKDTLFQVLDGTMQTDSGYLENIAGIAAGWTHSLARDEDGFVWAWGGNLNGQLGDNQDSGNYSNEPVQVLSGEQNPTSDPNDPLYIEFLQDIVNLAAGRSGKHSLAVDKYGLTWSWGINTYGQLGCGDTVTRYVPVAVYSGEQNPTQEPNQLSHIIQVSAGAYHSMALEDPNQGAGVYTFGCNYSGFGGGLLGVGKDVYELFQVTKPVKVLSGVQSEEPNRNLQNIVSISAGWHPLRFVRSQYLLLHRRLQSAQHLLRTIRTDDYQLPAGTQRPRHPLRSSRPQYPPLHPPR